MPVTAANFIKLVDTGFYDSLIFHRVISNFVIQGGDPTGLGNGGPGYTIADEYHPTMNHDSAGVIAMAKKGPGTAGSQFYITLSKQAHLDGDYPVFGTCIEGLDIIKKIGDVPTNVSDRPLTDVVMDSVRIVQDSTTDTTTTGLFMTNTTGIEVYPNPFNDQITINYYTKEKSHIRIDVLDSRSQLIATLENAHRIDNTYSIQWHSGHLPKGIYYLRLLSDKGIQTRKLIKIH